MDRCRRGASDHLTRTGVGPTLCAVRSTTLAIVAGAGCGLLGYAVGTRAAEPEPREAKPTPATQAGAEPARAERAVGGLVCAARQRPIDDDREDCDALELRARWCEAELADARRERTAVRQDWPDEDSVESAERWPDAVERALAECEIGAELELVDCTEYPCTAALRPATAPPTPEAFENEMKRLMGATRSCAPLREALGIDTDNLEKAVDVFRLDAYCGVGREDFFVLLALDPDGAAFDLLHRDRTDQEERDLNRWMYRRADDLSAMWPCE